MPYIQCMRYNVMCEIPGSNLTVGGCVFIAITTAIYSLGHGLRTLTAVSRSTRPSTLRGRKNEY